MPMPYPGIYQLIGRCRAPRLRCHPVTVPRHASTTTRSTRSSSAMAAPPSPTALVQLRVLGGAMARVPADATAFAHRDAPVMVAVLDHYEDPSTEAEQVAWTEALHERLAPNVGRGLLELPRARRASSGSTRRIPAPRIRDWPTSSAATTPRTCSSSTRTSARPSRSADAVWPSDTTPRWLDEPAGRSDSSSAARGLTARRPLAARPPPPSLRPAGRDRSRPPVAVQRAPRRAGRPVAGPAFLRSAPAGRCGRDTRSRGRRRSLRAR